MKQKTISLLLALALALSLAGCKKEETVTAPAGVAVQVQTVEAQDIASENTVSGQVTAGSETSVYVTARPNAPPFMSRRATRSRRAT